MEREKFKKACALDGMVVSLRNLESNISRNASTPCYIQVLGFPDNIPLGLDSYISGDLKPLMLYHIESMISELESELAKL